MVPIMLIAALALFLACGVGALLASSSNRPLVANLHHWPQAIPDGLLTTRHYSPM
jgi:hypothetical protein